MLRIHRAVVEQAPRYHVRQDGFWWWCVKAEDGTRTLLKAGTKLGAERLAATLEAEFQTGVFVGQQAALQPQAAAIPRTGCSAGTDDECTDRRCANGGCPTIPAAAEPVATLTISETPPGMGDSYLLEECTPMPFLGYGIHKLYTAPPATQAAQIERMQLTITNLSGIADDQQSALTVALEALQSVAKWVTDPTMDSARGLGVKVADAIAQIEALKGPTP